MTITICGSMVFKEKMEQCKKKLKGNGHTVFVPHSMGLEQAHLEAGNHKYTAERKVKYDLIRRHFRLIDKSDAILVINEEKNDIPNYIGGNTLLEIGYAFDKQREIFLLNAIPDVSYAAEIIATNPIALDDNLQLIDDYYSRLPISYIASTSSIKLSAAGFGLRQLGIRNRVKGLQTESGVPEQPLGLAQTITGVHNRLDQLKTQVHGQEYNYLISIESGMIFDEKKEYYFDIGACVIENRDGKREIAVSNGTLIPKDIAKEIISKGYEIGPYLQEKYQITEKDPAYYFTKGKVTREQLLQECVANCAVRLI